MTKLGNQGVRILWTYSWHCQGSSGHRSVRHICWYGWSSYRLSERLLTHGKHTADFSITSTDRELDSWRTGVSELWYTFIHLFWESRESLCTDRGEALASCSTWRRKLARSEHSLYPPYKHPTNEDATGEIVAPDMLWMVRFLCFEASGVFYLVKAWKTSGILHPCFSNMWWWPSTYQRHLAMLQAKFMPELSASVAAFLRK